MLTKFALLQGDGLQCCPQTQPNYLTLQRCNKLRTGCFKHGVLAVRLDGGTGIVLQIS